MEVNEAIKESLKATQKQLSGYARRHFMAQMVESIFAGNASAAERELGWNRTTMRKGLRELRGGFCYLNRYYERGRQKAEEKHPQLLSDIRAIVDGQSQTDPTFRTTRLYTRLSAAAVRQQLIEQKGYQEDDLPCTATIGNKLNVLGYRLRTVQKSRPKKNG